MKALVVDDSMVMRKILIGALAQAGITDVVQASDGQGAVDAVEKQDFGVVLLDWNMPKMLGIDALKAIRQKGNQVPVIMVTSEAEKSRVLEAIKAGATSFLVKPFEASTIGAKIKSVVEKSARAQAGK